MIQLMLYYDENTVIKKHFYATFSVVENLLLTILMCTAPITKHLRVLLYVRCSLIIRTQSSCYIIIQLYIHLSTKLIISRLLKIWFQELAIDVALTMAFVKKRTSFSSINVSTN